MSSGTEGYVQVANDGPGKKMRNVARIVQQADGTPVTVYEELVQIVGVDGNPIDFAANSKDLIDAIQSLTKMIAVTNGITDPDAGVDSETLEVLAASGLPAKAAEWNSVRALSDTFGRQITLPNASRDMVLTQGTTISASTSETVVLTKQPGVFLDLVIIVISNTSAATSTRIDVRDKVGGTVLFSLQSIGGGAPVGFAINVPIPQTTAGESWSVQCATSTTDIRVYAVAVKNK